ADVASFAAPTAGKTAIQAAGVDGSKCGTASDSTTTVGAASRGKSTFGGQATAAALASGQLLASKTAVRAADSLLAVKFPSAFDSLPSATEMASLAHELSGQANRRFLENVLRVMAHIEQRTQAELEWVRGLRAELLSDHSDGNELED
ncbi:hypothetical protein B4Q13_21090, partial [Lacticaseibacillus rhamnosus]